MTSITIEEISTYDSEKKCLTLAKNAEKRGRHDLAEAAHYRAAELRAEADIKAGRRPDIDYHYIGLRNGDKIILNSIGVEAEVFSHRTLIYKGREVYITPLEAELLKDGHPRKSVVAKWTVEQTGELLDDLYEKTYGKRPLTHP